jgi:predicted RNA-binding Zn ribbon-like protein
MPSRPGTPEATPPMPSRPGTPEATPPMPSKPGTPEATPPMPSRPVTPGTPEAPPPAAFTFVSGNHALDFAGTLRYRDAAPDDLLSSPGRLGEWSVAAGLVDRAPEVSQAQFARALAVREAVYGLARSAVTGAGRRRDDLDLVNAAAAAPPVTAVLVPGGLRRSGTADEVIATVARVAVGLLGGPDAGLIRGCEDPSCSRLFIDTSRAGSRRWCQMSGCGNRAKAAGFRARRAAGAADHSVSG